MTEDKARIRIDDGFSAGVPRSPEQLDAWIRTAQRKYKDALNDLAKREGFYSGPGYDVSTRAINGNPATAAEGEAALDLLDARVQRLNDIYFLTLDTPARAKAAREDYDRLVHNARSRLELAEINLRDQNALIDSRKKYGGPPPRDPIEPFEEKLEVRQGELDTALAVGRLVLDERFAELEIITPGSTKEYHLPDAGVEVEDAAVTDQADERRQRILDGFANYSGVINKKGKPKMPEFRVFLDMPDLSSKERNKLWVEWQVDQRRFQGE